MASIDIFIPQVVVNDPLNDGRHGLGFIMRYPVLFRELARIELRNDARRALDFYGMSGYGVNVFFAKGSHIAINRASGVVNEEEDLLIFNVLSAAIYASMVDLELEYR